MAKIIAEILQCFLYSVLLATLQLAEIQLENGCCAAS